LSTWKSFEEIEAWQLAREFSKDIYGLMENTSLKNDYKLKDQINGSSGSIMDNISEGFERNGNKEFIQFLFIAKASAGESRSQLYRIVDRNYISQEEFQVLREKVLLVSKKIQALINYLGNSDYKGPKYK